MYAREDIDMKEDIIPLASLALFVWSIWEFYNGNHTTAFYLLGASIYVTLALGVVYLFANNSLLDKLHQSSHEIGNTKRQVRS